MVDWDTNQVLVRYRPTASLMLEAIVLDNGTWEGVSRDNRETKSDNMSSTILPWEKPCAWYSSLPELKLPTAPGFSKLTRDVPRPSELKYRWLTQACVRKASRGRTIESRDDMEDYRKDPFLTPTPGAMLCWLPNVWSTNQRNQTQQGP